MIYYGDWKLSLQVIMANLDSPSKLRKVSLSAYGAKLANVSDSHEHPNDWGAAACGAGVSPFNVTKNMKGALLLGKQIRFR